MIFEGGTRSEEKWVLADSGIRQAKDEVQNLEVESCSRGRGKFRAG